MSKRHFLFFMSSLMLLFVSIQPVQASSDKIRINKEVESEQLPAEEIALLEQIETAEIDALIQDILKENIGFEEMVLRLMNGELPFEFSTILQLIKTAFFEEIMQNKSMMLSLFFVALMAALFTNFTRLLEKNSVSEIGFYILYLLLMAVLFKSFTTVEQLSVQVLQQMTEFMKLLMPAFFLTVVAAKGASTALVFYELILLLIYIVDLILLKLLLPMCSVYVIVSLVNQISQEDFFSKMTAFMKQIVLWILKIMFAVVTGINIVSSLLSPAIDGVKGGALKKALSGIPGIGNTLGSMSDVLLGSGVLIKNGVGVCILICLVFICLVPIVKIFVCMVLYKVAGVFVQPISDKRIVNCIETVADGAWLLMRCVITAMTLFFMTMAIVTAASG